MAPLIMPARPAEGTSLRPVPWRRMTWVTWRQHRAMLAGVTVFLGAAAVFLWRAGVSLHHAYAAAAACHPARSLGCGDLVRRFNGMDDFLANGSVLQAIPPLVGAFAGSPVIARELETSTYRYAWTQGFGRWRWTLAKLVVIAVVLTAGAAAISALFSWYYQPYFATGHQALHLAQASPLNATLFDLRGIAFAAWTLAAVAIGALAGTLIRRVVPAMAATLTGYAGIAFATGLYLRPHYLTPLIAGTQDVPGSALVTSQWGTKGGKLVFTGQPPRSLLEQVCSAPARGTQIENKSVTIAQCLSHHGYTWWTSYQPASRFWPLQWIESGWLLGLSALLIAATVWLVRRRAA